jgi:maleylpyruvate isomerase
VFGITAVAATRHADASHTLTSGKMEPMADLADIDRQLAHLVDAGPRLVRSVDRLSGDDWSAPSGLPGWTRAHVVAHLALNAEALGGVLRGEVEGSPVPMYESQDARDDDIEELSGADHAALRERLLAGTAEFPEAVQAVPPDRWEGRFERTRGGPTLPLRAVPLMRVREIEIHHVDLDVGYSPDDWPRQFAEELVDGMLKRQQPDEPFRVRPLDSDRTWEAGEPGDDPVVVTGPVAQVAWWLTGRTPGEQVSCSRGQLPQIGGW